MGNLAPASSYLLGLRRKSTKFSISCRYSSIPWLESLNYYDVLEANVGDIFGLDLFVEISWQQIKNAFGGILLFLVKFLPGLSFRVLVSLLAIFRIIVEVVCDKQDDYGERDEPDVCFRF